MVHFNLNLISRLRLHDGKLIKDRRYHLRTYPNCFVSQELIDWLVSHKEAPDRATAVCLMQHLMDHDIVHHGKREATTQPSVQREEKKGTAALFRDSLISKHI